MSKEDNPQSLPSAYDYYIHSIPNAPPNSSHLQQYAGHIPIDSDISTYFWLISNVQQVSMNPKLVIWFNGGPGCSSLEGMLIENGPLILDSNGKLNSNAFAWNRRANVLYVDQPVGSGFSFSKSKATDKSEPEVSRHFIMFLDKFFHVFPHLQKADIYLAGESFAGIYIPYIAREITARNNNLVQSISPTNSIVPWPLKGMIIGNGWIDSYNQYRASIDFAVKHNLLSGKYLAIAEDLWNNCKNIIDTDGPLIHINTCEQIVEQVIQQSKSENDGKCINIYDIRLRDKKTNGKCGSDWPDSLPSVYEFLKDSTNVNYIHATNSKQAWQECSDLVFDALKRDKSLASVTLLPELLKSVPLFLYSGDQDYVCNHLGTERMLKSLKWGTNTQIDPPILPAYLNQTQFGTLQQEGNITYALMYNCSHMVPIDNPEAMLAFIDHAIGIQPLSTESKRTLSPIGEDKSYSIPNHSAPPNLDNGEYSAGFGSGIILTLLIMLGAALLIVFRRTIFSRLRRRRSTKFARIDEEVDRIDLLNVASTSTADDAVYSPTFHPNSRSSSPTFHPNIRSSSPKRFD